MKQTLFGIITATSVCVAVFSLLKMRSLEATVAESRVTIAGLQNQLRGERPPPANSREAGFSSDTATPQTAATIRGVETMPPPARSDSPAQRDMSLPVVTQSRTERIRQRAEPRYQTLFAKLNLPAEKSERLIQAIVQRREVEAEAVGVAAQHGRDMNGLDVKRQGAAAQEQLEDAIRREFGDHVLSEYRRHEWLLSANDLITAASSSLKGQAAFSPQQKEQLVGLLANNFYAVPGTGRVEDPVPYRITLNDQVIQMISTIASPEQLAPFLRIKSAQERHLASAPVP
jgi:hypothetical protein